MEWQRNDCETGNNIETIALMLRQQKPSDFRMGVIMNGMWLFAILKIKIRLWR